MYNIKKIQCELYEKYCSIKRDVETSKWLFFIFWLSYIYIYIYIYIYVYYNNYVIITIFELEEQDEMTDGDDWDVDD